MGGFWATDVPQGTGPVQLTGLFNCIRSHLMHRARAPIPRVGPSLPLDSNIEKQQNVRLCLIQAPCMGLC